MSDDPWARRRADHAAMHREALMRSVASAIALSSGHWRSWDEVPESSKSAFMVNATAAVSAYERWASLYVVKN